MVKPSVVVCKGKNPFQTTRKALMHFHLPNLTGKRVLIKPNAARLASPGDGVTTHPQVVEGTIDVLRERGVKEIVIGEGCVFGVNAQEAFQITGFKEVSQKKQVKLIDLDRFEPAEKVIPDGKLLKKIKISSGVNDFDWVISVPVMKTHMHTQVSLSIKNMKGLLWRSEKARLHQLRSHPKIDQGQKTLDIAISEIATILMPHLVIIDGTTGMEGMGPAYGKPRGMGVVLVSNNAVSADAVAARLMGFQPQNIHHLMLTSKRGLGEINLDKISITPKDFMKWEVPFDSPPSKFSIPFPDVMVYDEGSCSACLSTLVVFLKNYYPDILGYRLHDEKFHIAIGKRLKKCPKGTILIGNCTSKMKHKGIFIRGCPPIASQIMNTIHRHLPFEQ